MRVSDFAGEHLVWAQPHLFRSEYELRRGDNLLATLRFRSEWGSLATAEVGAGCWTFKRIGFMQTRVSIRACGSEAKLGIFRNNTWSRGGTLELPDGRQYRANTNFWHTRYEFADVAGQPLIRYETEKFLRMSGEMQILPAAVQLPELTWLVMLGWYLAVMMYRDAADSVAITSG